MRTIRKVLFLGGGSCVVKGVLNSSVMGCSPFFRVHWRAAGAKKNQTTEVVSMMKSAEITTARTERLVEIMSSALKTRQEGNNL